MPLAVRLPREVEQPLQALAERTGRSKASCAREVIVRYLEHLEDEQLVLERLDNPNRRWTLDEREVDTAGQGDSSFACFEEWVSDADTLGYSVLGRSDEPAGD